jgi:hypothetical protein
MLLEKIEEIQHEILFEKYCVPNLAVWKLLIKVHDL